MTKTASFSPEIAIVDTTEGYRVWLSTAVAKYAWWDKVVPTAMADCLHVSGEWPLFVSRGRTLEFLTRRIRELGKASARLWAVTIVEPDVDCRPDEPLGVARLHEVDDGDPQLDVCLFGMQGHLLPRERLKAPQLERVAQVAVLGGMAAAFGGGASALSTEIYGDEVGVRTAERLRGVGFVGATGLTADSGSLAVMSAWSPEADGASSEARNVARAAYAQGIGGVSLMLHP
ncbi:MAG TPA: hypothetical protein VGS28_03215 [Candidatus Saccharimonadales bacterium]|nr:hypothetical protein [Candidatus Saccharimonadales bacterium]